MGGAREQDDTVDFPVQGRRLIRSGDRVDHVPLSAIKPMDWTKREA
jgi:hypothetical protein